MKKYSYRPYKKGYLSVGEGHKLYFELCGNPKGKPVLFLHGGPGSGFNEKHKKLFDPTVWNILLFDQRGARRSTPFASIENNTTQKLVEDTKMFLEYVGISQVFIVGGSWGSTLALVYAITYPKTVKALLLRGIFLGSKEENEHYIGGGVRYHFPEAWERFIALVPEDKRDDTISYYLAQMLAKDEKKTAQFSYEWAYYEMSLMQLKTDVEQIEKDLREYSFRSLSVLEAYYLGNNCFLPDNYILDNAAKLSSIPTSIIHGRYDFVCPPNNAYELHRRIRSSRLFFTIAGHASSEKETKKKLIEEVKRFAKLV